MTRPVVIRLPWFTLYGLPERPGRLARARCAAAMLVHEVVELTAGTRAAHSMRAAARYDIGAPTITVPASQRNRLYFTTTADGFPDLYGDLVGGRTGVELRVYASGTVGTANETIFNPGVLVETRLSNPTTGNWDLVGVGGHPRLPEFGRAVGFTDAVDGTATVVYIATPTPEMTGGSLDLVVPLGWTVQAEFTPAEFVSLAGSLPVVLIPNGDHVGLWRVVDGAPWEQVRVATGQSVQVVSGAYNGYPMSWFGWNTALGGAPDIDQPPTVFVPHSQDTEWVTFPTATPGNFFDTDPAFIVAPGEVDDYVSDSGTRVLTEALNSLVNEKPWGFPVGHVCFADPSFDPLTNTDSFPMVFGDETVLAEQFVLLAYTDGDSRNGVYLARDGQKWLKAHRRFDRIPHVYVDNVESPYDQSRWFRSAHPTRENEWVREAPLAAHNHDGVYEPAGSTQALADTLGGAALLDVGTAPGTVMAGDTVIPAAYTDEMARDAIGTALTAGTGITVTPSDGADTITVATTITQYTDEMARDALGMALTAGTGITVTPNDGADTITVATTITQYTDEMARDALGTAITAGTGITKTVDDAGDTITLATVTDQFYTSGNFYNAPNINSGGTRAISTGNATATPFLIEKAVTINGLQIDLSAVVAGGPYTFDLHVCTINTTTGYPTTSLFTVPVTTTGTGTQVLSNTASPVTLSPGLYWTVVHNRSAGTITARSVASTQGLSPVPQATTTSANQLSCYMVAAGTSVTPIAAYPAAAPAFNQGPIVSIRVN